MSGHSKLFEFILKAIVYILPDVLKNYSVSFNSAGSGFFDKSVLETLSSGMLTFYKNPDFDELIGDAIQRDAKSVLSPIWRDANFSSFLRRASNTLFSSRIFATSS